MDKRIVGEIIKKAQIEKRWLMEHEAMDILKAYDISVPKYYFVHNAEEALEGALKIGYPVVLKIVSPDVLHKSDAGCVKLNLRNSDEVRDAFGEIIDNAIKYDANARIIGLLVYPMLDPGLETIIGVTEDAQFGAAIMFGLGGIFVEVLKDVVFRILPLEHDEVLKMIKETKGYKLLEGIRGESPKDINSLVETIIKISRLCTDFPEIKELDLNPTYVYEKGVKVVDARVRVS